MSFIHTKKEPANGQALVDIGVSQLIGCNTLSIQKSWMKKRLNLTLSASNFLKKYKTFDYQTTDTYFEAANWSKSVAQRFAVTVSYRIGELKASVRKAERSISNDDVKSGGGNSSGGEKQLNVLKKVHKYLENYIKLSIFAPVTYKWIEL